MELIHGNIRRMKAQPGINCTDLWKRNARKVGKRWWFRVTVRGHCCSRAFADEDRGVGLEWAKLQRREMEREDFTPKPAKLSEALKVHLAELRGSDGDGEGRKGRSAGRTSRSEGHIDEIERVVNGLIATGVDDLRARDALAKAQKYVLGLDVAPITRSRHAAHLRATADVARRIYRLAGNPLADLTVDVPELAAPATFDVDEGILLASDKALAQPFGLMVALALYAGLRLREAAWLRWEDVRWTDDLLAIDPPTDAERDKGAKLKRNKSRNAILMPELAAILKPLCPKSGVGYLMPETIREANTRDHGRFFAKHLIAAGVTQGERTYHSLRHTFAGFALAAGLDSMRLQLAMGHTSKDLTKHYAQSAARLRAKVKHWPAGEIALRAPVKAGKAVGQ